MRRIIFYSWQSDLPNSTNRGFIQQALERAAAAIAADGSVAVEPVVDRDTQGIAGAPDIASTIFAKITAADIVVADVSIISRPKKVRPSPNPNVLIELGYALKALGYQRVILVFNRAFGKIEELPFDLRMRRVVIYNMPERAKERAPVRVELEGRINAAIRAALEHVETATESVPPIPAVDAIENSRPNRIIILRRNLDELFKNLYALQPIKHSEGGTSEDLIQAIDRTQEVVAEFSKIAEMASVMNDIDSALEIHKWFGRIFECYSLPKNHSGRSNSADFDYFKFVGHEMFVTLIAFLIREQRWDIIERILEEPISLGYLASEHGPGNVYWSYASKFIPLLYDENTRKGRVSVHADILHTRHTKVGLAAVLPFDDFVAADFFLFLCAEIPPEKSPEGFWQWPAWSGLYLNGVPGFIRGADQARKAERLAKLFEMPSVAEFKKRLTDRAPRLNKLFNNNMLWPITEKDIDRIGIR